MPARWRKADEKPTADALIEYVDEFIQPTDDQVASWSVLVDEESGLPALTGDCPCCGHESGAQVTAVVVIGGTLSSGKREPAETMTRQIICNCHKRHKQPPGTPGCGRYWLAVLSLRDDQSYELAVQKDVRLLSSSAALNEMLATQNERIQRTAEKWIGAVTAIYGLFTLTGIATAQKALSGMSVASEALVAATLVASLACAGLALVTGYTAAYGWPKAMMVRNDKQLQAWHAEFLSYAETAARQLRRAVFLSFSSLGALVIVMLLVWFLPRHPG